MSAGILIRLRLSKLEADQPPFTIGQQSKPDENRTRSLRLRFRPIGSRRASQRPSSLWHSHLLRSRAFGTLFYFATANLHAIPTEEVVAHTDRPQDHDCRS